MPGAEPAAPPPPPQQPPYGQPPQAEPGFQFGAGAQADLETGGFGAEASEEEPEVDAQYRTKSFKQQSSLAASTGLFRVHEAGAGAAGTFKMSLLWSIYSGSGFLCNAESPCPIPPGDTPEQEDDVFRVGHHMAVSATLFSFLEAFLGFHNYATSNDRGRPGLLEVLGDLNIGAKGFSPYEPDTLFSYGGELDLRLVNGSGDVGFDGSSTGFGFRGLLTTDFNNRTNPDDRIPLRLHLNLGYSLDNSAQVVDELENTPPPVGRGGRVTRVERFGLNIDRVDSFEFGLGAEVVHDIIRPFLEWTIDVPVNRQGYVCVVEDAAAAGDLCLGNESGFSTSPSRLTLGARVFPWQDLGLAGTIGLDIGTGATSRFIEEVAPEPSYNFYIGVSYAVDTEPAVQVEKVEPPPPPVIEPRRYFVGKVLDANTGEPIPSAILRFEGRPLPGVVTSEEGKFRTVDLDPGTYTFNVTADDYKPGKCSGTIPSVAPPRPGSYGAPAVNAGQPAGGMPQPATPQPGGIAPPGALQPGTPQEPGGFQQSSTPPPGATQPGPVQYGPDGMPVQQGETASPMPGTVQPPFPQPGAVGAEPGEEAFGGAPSATPADIVVELECKLEPTPPLGIVVGGLVDAVSGEAVGYAQVTITDNLGRQLSLKTDAQGAFRFENVPPGEVYILTEAPDYLPNSSRFKVEARKEVQARIALNPRPKNPNVVVTQREVKLKKRVHFQHNSADIALDSMALLEEAADVLRDRTDLQLVEIQGHTDNTGTSEYNLSLSQRRAEAVREALVKLGVDGSRLEARGYGDKRPLVPNVTDANREKNRRVQLIIKQRGR